ncbi:MAG: hypothetical protein RR428_06960 [Coprobacillus sp.]
MKFRKFIVSACTMGFIILGTSSVYAADQIQPRGAYSKESTYSFSRALYTEDNWVESNGVFSLYFYPTQGKSGAKLKVMLQYKGNDGFYYYTNDERQVSSTSNGNAVFSKLPSKKYRAYIYPNTTGVTYRGKVIMHWE